MALLSYMEETVEEAPPRDDVSASRKKRARRYLRNTGQGRRRYENGLLRSSLSAAEKSETTK